MSWKDNLIKIEPYVAGEQPNKTDFIKLNANENPYPPAPGVIRAIEQFRGGSLKKYPDANAKPLAEALAKRFGLKAGNVFLGNGSDDVLALCFRAFFNSDKPVIYPDITYSFYPVWCDMLRIPYETIPVDESFNIDPADYKRPNGGVVIANPNAPTSIGRGLEFMREILDANPDSVVIADEAYVDFGAQSALPLIEKYDNLLVVQTFSKSRSMAGMRIGYALGNEVLIKYLNDVKYSFNSYTMNRTSIELGVAALEDQAYFEKTVRKIQETREWTAEELKKLGFSFHPSKANFIFARHARVHAKEIFAALREAHIYVRYFNKPRIDDYLRITIGTQEEMEKFVAFLREYLK